MKDYKTIEVVAVLYGGNVREFFYRDKKHAYETALFWERAEANVLMATYKLASLPITVNKTAP